jgi:hypothetical protein
MWVQICLLYHIEEVDIVNVLSVHSICIVVSLDHGYGLSPEYRDPPSLWEESCVVREAESVRSHKLNYVTLFVQTAHYLTLIVQVNIV